MGLFSSKKPTPAPVPTNSKKVVRPDQVKRLKKAYEENLAAVRSRDPKAMARANATLHRCQDNSTVWEATEAFKF